MKRTIEFFRVFILIIASTVIAAYVGSVLAGILSLKAGDPGQIDLVELLAEVPKFLMPFLVLSGLPINFAVVAVCELLFKMTQKAALVVGFVVLIGIISVGGAWFMTGLAEM